MSAEHDTTGLLERSVDELLARSVAVDEPWAAEGVSWAGTLWDAVALAGLPWIGVSEAAGGQGGSLADAAAVLRAAGRHSVPLPIPETGMLAGWLLAESGLEVPLEPLSTVAPNNSLSVTWDGSSLTGVLHHVPWARSVSLMVFLVDTRAGVMVAGVRPESARIVARRNLAGESRDEVTLDRVVPDVWVPAGQGVDHDALACRGALSRACLMTGALERVRDLTLRYVNEREQFGRPLAAFQAVQEHMVHIAQQVAISQMATDLAIREAASGPASVETWAAKSLVGEAARIATCAAHQAHGAMGMTQEYRLHHATRRLWSWTWEYGDASWSRRLGRLVAERGANALYPLIADGSSALHSAKCALGR